MLADATFCCEMTEVRLTATLNFYASLTESVGDIRLKQIAQLATWHGLVDLVGFEAVRFSQHGLGLGIHSFYDCA